MERYRKVNYPGQKHEPYPAPQVDPPTAEVKWFKPGTDQVTLSLAYVQWTMSLTANPQNNLRFGHYFLNKYRAEGTAWPEVFYETDPQVAYQRISEHMSRHPEWYAKLQPESKPQLGGTDA